MWNLRPGEDRNFVTCIACGDRVPRDQAREYDKYGDRWERSGKHFEHFCKACDRDRCRQPRGDLEDVLYAIEGQTRTRDQFLSAYVDAVYGGSESVGEPDR